jgi:hypothetical protein
MVYGGYKNYLGHSKIAMSNVYVYPDASRDSPFCMMTAGQDPGHSGYNEKWQNNACIASSANVYE